MEIFFWRLLFISHKVCQMKTRKYMLNKNALIILKETRGKCILGLEYHMHDTRQWNTFTKDRYTILRSVVWLQFWLLKMHPVIHSRLQKLLGSIKKMKKLYPLKYIGMQWHTPIWLCVQVRDGGGETSFQKEKKKMSKCKSSSHWYCELRRY